MLKITKSLNKLVFNKNNRSKSASNKNNNCRSAFGKNNGDNNVKRFCVSENDEKHVKKSKNCLSQENQKVNKYPNLEIWLSKKKSC